MSYSHVHERKTIWKAQKNKKNKIGSELRFNSKRSSESNDKKTKNLKRKVLERKTHGEGERWRETPKHQSALEIINQKITEPHKAQYFGARRVR